MKLLFCKRCADVVKILLGRRGCMCGRSWAVREQDRTVAIGGYGVPLSIHDKSFHYAVAHRPPHGQGLRFKAVVIPADGLLKPEGSFDDE